MPIRIHEIDKTSPVGMDNMIFRCEDHDVTLVTGSEFRDHVEDHIKAAGTAELIAPDGGQIWMNGYPKES